MTDAVMSGLRIILSTCGDRAEAERIAHSLVEAQLAACVNLVAGVHSVYRWQGKIESSGEVLLLIKTHERHVERIEKAICELHSYTVPEFLVLEILGGSEPYLQWLAGSLQ